MSQRFESESIQDFIINLIRSGSLNKDAATATVSSELILKVAYLMAIFKIIMEAVSRKHLGNTHRLGGSSHLPLPVRL